MSKKPIAYLAGPLGFSEVGKYFYYGKLIPLVTEVGFDIRDPWVLTPFEKIEPILAMPYGAERKEAWARLNPTIGKNNEDAIEESDIIIAVLDGTDVDSGTASEIGYGAAFGKPTIGYRGDFRLACDNEGSIVNLQVERFIYKPGGVIVTDMESLEVALIKYRDKFLQGV